MKKSQKMVGRKVKIIVDEPYEWNYGNLFGIIENIENYSLKVRLTTEIQGDKLTSNLIELKTRYEKETFRPLLENCEVTIGGQLIEDNSNNFDYIIIGRVSILNK